MVASNFLDLLKKFEVGSYIGLEDGVDQLNFLFTTVLFLLSSFIVTCNTYFLDSISCYTSVYPSGQGYDKYLNNYCWTSGTLVLPKGTSPPNSAKQWKEAKQIGFIAYYQWIPFVLAIQCVMFMIPYWIWRSVYLTKGGCDFVSLLKKGKDCQKMHGEKETEVIRKVAEKMEEIIYSQRDFREGCLSSGRRGLVLCCGVLVPSKRQGTNLVTWYLLMKVLYLTNLVGQVYIFHLFLGVYTTPLKLMNQLIFEIINGQTVGNIPLFPKITFCRLPGVRTGASKDNEFVSQCVLPVNMLSEKVYLVLYVWILILSLIVLMSTVLWLYRTMLSSRVAFIKRAIVSADNWNKNDKRAIHSFVTEFLRQNGVFLLQMFKCNVGDLVTRELINQLWLIYRQKYKSMDKYIADDQDSEDMANDILL